MYESGTNGDAVEPNRILPQAAESSPRPAGYIKAVGAPHRRRILRTLHVAGEARSPKELARAFSVPLGNTSYHVGILRKCRAIALTDTRLRRGAVEHFYASTVGDNELILQLLELTKADDEKQWGRRSA